MVIDTLSTFPVSVSHIRETILMIKRTGTAMFNQVRQRGQRAEINDVVIDNLKDAIDFIDPIDDRQVRIIDRPRRRPPFHTAASLRKKRR